MTIPPEQLPPEWRNPEPSQISTLAVVVAIILMLSIWLLITNKREPKLPDHCHPTNWK